MVTEEGLIYHQKWLKPHLAWMSKARDESSPHKLHSLKLTAKTPENRPGPKRKGSCSNHPFPDAMLVFGRVASFCWDHLGC